MTLYKRHVVYQDADEVIRHSIFWGSALAAGDTIDTVVNMATGVTISGESNTTTSNSFFASNVSGITGFVTTEITTAGGETLQETTYFEERVA